MQNDIKIKDVVIPDFPDFFDFCSALGKYYISELTDMDFIAYRANYNHTREFVSGVKKHIETECSKFDDNDNKIHKIDTLNDELVNEEDDLDFDNQNDIGNESNEINSQSINKIDGSIPLYIIYDLDPSEYNNKRISDYPFPTALKNRLNAAGYFSMYDLLNMSKHELTCMKGIGGKIIDKVDVILNGLRQKNARNTSINCFDAKKHTNQILVGDFSFKEDYPQEVHNIIEKFERAFEDLGEEIVSDFRENTFKYFRLCCYLKK